ncbi:MAG: hypothetical protein HWE10_12445 [Gammaproteobacteria bacterium]|nr:hypothetical protein [Gammaproteobacteria bacterium]
MNNKNKLTTSLLTAIALAGCGGESTINVVAEPAPPLVGQFVDAPVAGLQFKITREASGVSEEITGVTDANGNFEYYRGDSVTFHIGDIEFPATAGANFITPLQVFRYDTPFNDSVTNALVLLQTLDSDGNPDNGISISESARTAAVMNLADGETVQDFFSRDPEDFADDIETWVGSAGTVNTQAVSPASAQLHFVNYVEKELGFQLGNPFNVSKFSGVVFNPTVVNQVPVTHSYEFTPTDDENLDGSFVFTDADTDVAPVTGTYKFVFGRQALELTSGDQVTYLISRSYDTVDDVYSLCKTESAEALATLVQDCAFEDDSQVNLLTFSQEQTDVELIALDEKKNDVGVELIEEFSTTTENFLTSSYKSLSKKLADRPLYVETGGNIAVDDTTGVLQLAGARFTIGNAAPVLESGDQAETAATDTVGTGIYNISEGFTISFDIVGHGTGGSLSLYVDNNSTSQGKSLHGDASKFFGKSLAEVATWSEFEADASVGVGKFTYTYTPGDDVVNGANSDPATDRGVLNTNITNSFFQFRTDSAGDITIDNLRIDTVADTVDASDLFIPPSAITFNDTVDFTADPAIDMFSPEYLNLAGEATSGDDQPGEADNIAMFALTGGSVVQEVEGVALTGGSFTMGDYLPGESTTAADTNSTGVLDLSRPYQIVLTIDSVTQRGANDTFEIYVDNDTATAANSVHGADSLIYQADVSSLTAGEMVIDNDGAGIDVGTAKSFLQFISTGTSKVVISSITIEPYVPPVPIKVSLPYEVDFSEAGSADNLFTAEFQAVDGEVGVTDEDTPMFYKTGGTVVVDSNSVVLDNSRFSIGNHTPESGGSKLETSADDATTTGVFDLSRPYTISFDVVDAVKTDTSDSSTSFMIYVDNNTSSSGKSIHGSDSKFYSVDIEEFTAGTTVTVDGFLATATSFIQLRAESGAKIELNNLRIEYADPNVFFEETFDNTGADFFSTEYRTLPDDSSTPMYFKTGGTAEVTENSTLLITSDRFTIGHSIGEKDTTTDADSTTVGVFDFSKPYKIVFDVILAEEPTDDKDNSFQIYMDNNTSSSSKSIHGGDSKFYSIKIADMTPGTYEVEGFIGTATSFLQLRAESGANVEIDNLRFEYLSTNEVLSEDFETDADTFFSADYKALSSDENTALYKATGGSSRLTIADGELTIDNARFSIGETAPDTETSGEDTSASGDLDLSKAYKITFDVISASEPDAGDQDNSFMMYVDNNTSSSSKSMHGGDSKFYSIKIADMTAGTVEVDGFVATENSFIQLRAESGAVVVIDNFKIEYVEQDAVLAEQFETTSDDLFTADYAALPDGSAPLYVATGGSSRLTVTDGQLTIDNARFTIGETSPDVETTGDDTTSSGALDLSKAYKITMDVISASEPDAADQDNSFMLYVDNNTSGSSNSMHGGDSKFYSVKIADLTVGKLEIDGLVATETSFIQLRAESGAVVVIDNLTIEYTE